MKKILFTLTFLSLSVGLWAQGMKFEHGSWKEVLALAKETKKPVFVDIYTTWCGPCKMMSNEIFPQKIVGDHFNANFINFKIDAEKGEGIELAEKFAVRVYPTYLYVDENGDLVYRAVGSKPAQAFIEESKKALLAANSTENLDYFKSNYDANKNDLDFLKKYISKLNDLSLDPSQVLRQYLDVLPQDQKVSQEVFDFIGKNAQKLNAQSEIFKYYLANKEKFDQLAPQNNKIAKDIFYSSAYREIVYAGREKNEAKFNKVLADLDRYYNGEDKEGFEEAYFRASGDTEKYFSYLCKRLDKVVADGIAGAEKKNDALLEENIKMAEEKYKDDPEKDKKIEQFKVKLRKYFLSQNAMQLNSAAWEIGKNFKADKDKNKLNKAIGWAKFALELTPEDYNILDTYACLQYLNGDKKNAVQNIQKAVALAKDDMESLKEFQSRLVSMKSGKDLVLD